MTEGETPADARARALLALTERLFAVAQEAQTHLTKRTLMPPERLEEQTRLAAQFRLEMARVKADPAQLRGASKVNLEALTAANARLRGLFDRHHQELKALTLISEGLAEAMAQEAARQARPATAYAASGMLTSGAAAPAVAINRQA